MEDEIPHIFLKNWNKMCRPPQEALKTIQAGRLKGKLDINPVWRIKKMTEVFGPVGEGWKYEIKDHWLFTHQEEPNKGQTLIFVSLEVTAKNEKGEWGAPVPAINSAELVAKEKTGLRVDDEAIKKAVTGALGVAMKFFGIGADVYMGLFEKEAEEKEAEWQIFQKGLIGLRNRIGNDKFKDILTPFGGVENLKDEEKRKAFLEAVKGM